MPTEDSKESKTSGDQQKDEAIQVNSKPSTVSEKPKPEELSEEDQNLKEGLELAVVRLQEDDDSLHKPALDHLVNEIRSSTASMTSVPKPLKFLRPHYETLRKVYESWPMSHSMKKQMADVMSVLAMTMASAGSRECLKFKLLGTQVNVSSWGHEYVRALAGEISEEFNARTLDSSPDDEVFTDDLMKLVDDILPFQMQHNAEAEAVDLLMEVRQLNKLLETPVVDERNYERVCLYLLRSANYVIDPDDLNSLFRTTFTIYKKQKKFTDALRVAIKIDSDELVADLFNSESNAPEVVKRQMSLILARHKSPFVSDESHLNELIGNCKLSEQFREVALSMDLSSPKAPEDIYKTQVGETSSLARRNNNATNAATDSARANLASTFVNAFVNAGFCSDTLMTEENSGWLFKNKSNGVLSAAASLGMIMLWNVEEGINQIDKFLHHNDEFVKAGACLGIGIVSSGVRDESDACLALLTDFIESSGNQASVRTASICGLGLAYAGARKEELKDILESIVSNTETTNITDVSLAALSLGLIYIGTCNDDISSVLLQRLMESSEADLNHTASRYLCLGLGLIYLGKGEMSDAVLEAVRTIEHKRGKYAEITLETCAYAGTGNVLKVQQMLRLCAEHLTEGAEHQAVAVLGIAMTAMGEEVGAEMTLRTFDHLLQYGELPVRRVVPLALSLLYVSNPEYSVIDQLSRLSHDQDAEVSQCAIFGLGLVSAGSNNSRVANLLRQLVDFYSKEANHLFVVRVAQGLNAMGKGLMSLNPYHSDR